MEEFGLCVKRLLRSDRKNKNDKKIKGLGLNISLISAIIQGLSIMKNFSHNNPENIMQPFYSSDLVARSLVRVGIPRYKAYKITHDIWEEMGTKHKDEKVLVRKVLKVLKEKYPQLVSPYRDWRKIMKHKKPLIILIGGATGIGTSTLAVRLGWLLEINHILGSDSVREIIRQFMPQEITPILNVSTYQTDNFVKHVKSHKDGLIYGFISQSDKVIYGIAAIIKRAIKEKESMVIEGVHLVPGEMNFLEKYKDDAVIVPIILDVNKEETHKEHFFSRHVQNKDRSSDKYLKYFAEIRLIRDYLVQQAGKFHVPVIENYNMRKVEEEVLTKIYARFFSPKKNS